MTLPALVLMAIGTALAIGGSAFLIAAHRAAHACGRYSAAEATFFEYDERTESARAIFFAALAGLCLAAAGACLHASLRLAA